MLTFQRLLPLAGIALLSIVAIRCSDTPIEPVAPQAETQVQKMALTPPYLVPAPGGATHFLPEPPADWKDLVVYGHGYYSPYEAAWTPEDDKIDETSIQEIVHGLGFAYASTSYPDGGGGLVVPQAVVDMKSLVEDFQAAYGEARHVYIVGPSLGGIITTLAVEKYPRVFNGGMSLCGPVGDFRKQIDYLGDFNVLYNVYFNRLKITNPENLRRPPSTTDWESAYEPRLRRAIGLQPQRAGELVRVSGAAIDRSDPSSVVETIMDVLWYNVYATKDAIERLRGQPFNNQRPLRFYRGSEDDRRLNRSVQRVSASPAALRIMEGRFQTTGKLLRPLVNLHTTRDPIVPYWHASLYRWKVLRSGSFQNYIGVPIFRYGHCEFKVSELLAGFAILVLKVTAEDLLVAERLLPDPESRARFLQLAREQGASPKIVEEAAEAR
ncbi:MAG: alpha/beta hydrolase [Bacteroidota bacterium]